jgi:tyrosine-protein phosphatase SIW14
MAEKTNAVTISRRSTRLFVEEQQPMEAGNALGCESKHLPGDEKQRERSAREAATSSSNIQVLRMPVVDLGKPLCPIFPTTLEDIEKQGAFLLVRLRLTYAV